MSHVRATFFSIFILKSEKQEIIDKHNELRSKVAKGLETRGADGKPQPSAANMRKLSWDDDIAIVAQV